MAAILEFTHILSSIWSKLGNHALQHINMDIGKLVCHFFKLARAHNARLGGFEAEFYSKWEKRPILPTTEARKSPKLWHSVVRP